MKFNVFAWDEVKTNETIKTQKGLLRVRFSAPCALYIQSEGYEALAGYGTSFDLDLSEHSAFKVEAPEGVRAFVHRQENSAFEAHGETFTNIDRMVEDSGPMAEVKKALRMFQMERNQSLAEIRTERRALSKLREKTETKAETIAPKPTEDVAE